MLITLNYVSLAKFERFSSQKLIKIDYFILNNFQTLIKSQRLIVYRRKVKKNKIRSNLIVT